MNNMCDTCIADRSYKIHAGKDRCRVVLTSDGGVKQTYLTGLTEEEAVAFCCDNDWSLLDENGYCWLMDFELEEVEP